MFYDARIDYSRLILKLVGRAREIAELPATEPYFYILAPKGLDIRTTIPGIEDELVIDETTYRAVTYDGVRYRPDPRYVVYRAYTDSPNKVPQLVDKLSRISILRFSGFNVKYVVRNCFDNFVRFFGVRPLYIDIDDSIVRKLSSVELLVLDVECKDGKPWIVSLYLYRPFEEVRVDDVETLVLPSDEDRLSKVFEYTDTIAGHNVLGFDIPVLKKHGFDIDTSEMFVFDTSQVLATHGSSLGVGSARSLLDVAMVLKEEVGITDRELEIKKRVGGRIDKLGLEDVVLYNKNDVVLTAKIMNSIFTFIAAVSGLFAVPPSVVSSVPSGIIAEYYLLRRMELSGYVPEYRRVEARLEADRVFTEAEGREYTKVLHLDVKMMYPSFVLANYIDPTYHVGGENFDPRAGLGFLYSAVKHLVEIRKWSKDMKKRVPEFEPVDKGIKAILNALAYGVQAKKSSPAIMGNPYCPSKIFYGTYRAQFDTINYLRNKGYKVIYSDTDSLFIVLDCRDESECVELAKKVIDEANEYLGRYGLEADMEEIWDYMYIHAKKNYIVRKGTKIIIKGSAIRNIEKLYTPECVSLLELLRIPNKEDRRRYVEEAIEFAPIEELFVRTHQMLWRLIGKDIQSVKRLGERRARYMMVYTPWESPYTLYLKRCQPYHWIMPHSAPIISFAFSRGNEVDLEEESPYEILELLMLPLEYGLSYVRARYGSGDIIVYLDKPYLVDLENIEYVIRTGGKVWRTPSYYSGVYPPRPIGTIEKIAIRARIKPVELEEHRFRSAVKDYVIRVLKSYNIL